MEYRQLSPKPQLVELLMLSLNNLRSALSAERLNAYALPGDADEVDSVARYLWNLALCSALQPALHTLEVTVRNRLFRISKRIVDETSLSFDKVPCWLDAQPPMLAPSRASSRSGDKAKKTDRKAKPHDAPKAGLSRPWVSHHEAVWDRNLNRSHQDILQTIAWITPDLATTLEEHSPLPTVLDKGVTDFRAQAEAIIE